jgi:hypothetical protein
MKSNSELADILTSGALGRVVLYNIVDCIEQSLVDEPWVKELCDWWFALYNHTFGSLESTNKDCENLIAVLRAVVQDPLPEDFPLDKDKPEFRCKFPAVTNSEVELKPNRLELSTSITHDSFSKYMLTNEGDEGMFSSRPIEGIDTFPGVARIFQNIDVRFIDTSSGLGRPGGVFWFTEKPMLKNPSPESVRDSLGLIHYKNKTGVVVLDFELEPTNSHRPTFADAANHSRFKARPHSATPPPDWGVAIDLAKFDEGAIDPDGLPERVSRSLKISTVKVTQCTYLGKTVGSRGESVSDNDEKFAILLARDRDMTSLKTKFLSYL